MAPAASFQEAPAPIFKHFYSAVYVFCYISVQLKLAAISWLLRVFRYDPFTEFPFVEGDVASLPPQSPSPILWSTLNLSSGQISIQCLHFYVHVAILHSEPHVTVLGLHCSLPQFLMSPEINNCSVSFSFVLLPMYQLQIIFQAPRRNWQSLTISITPGNLLALFVSVAVIKEASSASPFGPLFSSRSPL